MRSRVDPSEGVRIAALTRALRDLNDPSYSGWVTFLMHDDVDAATDLFSDGLERQVDAAHEGHRLDPHERVRRAVRVRGRQRPAVPGVHRLQHVEGLTAAHLADE